MVLKPQDLFVALKIAAERSNRPPYAKLANDLCMSSSEVHASVKRAAACHLLHGSDLNHRANLAAIEEFMVHGLKYAFPAELGGLTRGIPTAYAAGPLLQLVVTGTEPVPVWPFAEGTARGLELLPLYSTAPPAALKDPQLYDLLALADTFRSGRPREQKLAQDALTKILRARR